MQDGIDEFEAAGKHLDQSVSAALASGTLDPKTQETINHGMMQVERNWLNPDGIPGRPWFKHILYGARYTYAHLELPGLTEATEKDDWTTASQQAAILQRALATNTQLLEPTEFRFGWRGKAAPQKTSLQSLQSELETIRSQFPGDMSIYMKNLSSGEEIALDSDTVYETFSVIKLAIASELMHQVESGKLSLAERITLTAGNERLPSGVLYTMDPGLTPTVRDLLTLMIIISDNEATDALGDKVGRANVTAYMHSLGLEKTSIQFSDLDWDRTWLGTLDPAYRNATGDQDRRLSVRQIYRSPGPAGLRTHDLRCGHLFRSQHYAGDRSSSGNDGIRQAGFQAGQRPDSGHHGKTTGQRPVSRVTCRMFASPTRPATASHSLRTMPECSG